MENLDLSIFNKMVPGQIHTVRCVLGYFDENDDKKFEQYFLTGTSEQLKVQVEHICASRGDKLFSCALCYVGSFDVTVPQVFPVKEIKQEDKEVKQ